MTSPQSARSILEKLGNDMNEHFGINDFDMECSGCKKLVEDCLAKLTELVEGERKHYPKGIECGADEEMNGWNSCIDRIKELMK